MGVTAFVSRFTNDTLEKFILMNSRHARSGEMRRRLYYGHPKFGQVRLPINAATNADFLNYIGTNMLKHFCRDNWTFESLC